MYTRKIGAKASLWQPPARHIPQFARARAAEKDGEKRGNKKDDDGEQLQRQQAERNGEVARGAPPKLYRATKERQKKDI